MYLSHFNIARLKAPLSDPSMAAFVDGLEYINRLAERSPGFIQRVEFSTAHGAGSLYDDPLIAGTLSVWSDYESLHQFTYRSAHGAFTANRSRWFDRIEGPTTVLWWIEYDHRPELAEARARMRHLRLHGPSVAAFSLRRRYGPEGRPTARHTATS